MTKTTIRDFFKYALENERAYLDEVLGGAFRQFAGVEIWDCDKHKVADLDMIIYVQYVGCGNHRITDENGNELYLVVGVRK